MLGEEHEDCYDSDECLHGCDDRECGYNNHSDPVCPDCGASGEAFELVCGDHGTRCSKCDGLFCCP